MILRSPRVIFGNTFDGLQRVTRERLDAALLDRLRLVGVDYGRPLLPAYPAETFVSTIHLLGGALYPDLPKEEQLRRMGRTLLDGYLSTLIGKAVQGVARVIGTKATLDRMTQNFRSSDNFTEARISPIGPTAVELWLNDDLGMPAYYLGFFERVVEASGGRDPQVELLCSSPPGLVLKVAWGS